MGATEGVSEENVEEENVEEEIKSRRDEDYEALVARREAERAEPEEVPEAPEAPEEPEGEPEEKTLEFKAEDGTVIKVPATAKINTKIDGQESDESIDAITRGYQKGAAADSRLEEATRRIREIDQREVELKAAMEKLKADASDLSKDGYEEKVRNYLKSQTAIMLDEDPENPGQEAVDALAVAMRELTTPTNPEDIVAQAQAGAIAEMEKRESAKKAAKWHKDRESANARFEKEYEDIVKDPVAYSAAKQLARDKWEKDPDAKPWEVAEAVGNEVRAWKGKAVPKKPAASPTRNKVAGRVSVGKDKPPETRKSVLDEMRQQRGQPVI